MINEQFLSYIWQFGLFEHRNLQTTSNNPVQIIQVGTCNTQSGPDFFNARLQIGDTVWAGNIEIHVKASDWLKHQHQLDKAYNNVILHVVWEADIPIIDANGQALPCIALDGRVSPNVWQNYQQIAYSSHSIPCANLLPQADSFTISLTIERLLVERLEEKIEPLNAILSQNQHHWEATFYSLLCRALGSKANSDAMQQVAQSVALPILAKEKNDLLSLEALFLGQAGLLDSDYLGNNADDYAQQLQMQYRHFCKKYGLQPLSAAIWKFGGLRPPNFPTIRLAQLAALVHQSNHLFSKILHTEDPAQLLALFQANASEYWNLHYNFGKKSGKSSIKKIGDATLQLIVINTVVPLLFLYGKERALPHLQDRALQLLSQIAPENNSVIDEWRTLKMPIETAFESQAFLQLYKQYCQPKRCLQCSIGNKLLRTEIKLP
jgi:hypothetical protein